MAAKKYTSYAEIDQELQILKAQKEKHYQILVSGIQKTGENFTPQGIVRNFVGSYKSILAESYLPILQLLLPKITRWLLTKWKDK